MPNFVRIQGEQNLYSGVVVFHAVIVHLFVSRWIKSSIPYRAYIPLN
jgi:hypothetical protein